MPDYTETIIAATGVRSLVWVGDTLVDWAAGGRVYALDGSCRPANVNFDHPFDAAISTPNGEFAAVYERVGTKGLLLHQGTVLRELRRSDYQAHAFEYPICLLTRQERTLLVHCPVAYNRLEIDDVLSGERLTTRPAPSVDYFHSRLSASPGGDYLLSAGWVWHPWDAVCFYDIDHALRAPQHLDSLDRCLPTSRNICSAEESSACWQTPMSAIVAAGPEPEDPDEDHKKNELRLQPNGIVVYNILSRIVVSACVLDAPAGTIMPIGLTHAIAFYDHPRLVRLVDGLVEFSIPAIVSGKQVSSITWSQAPPPLALDAKHARFAIAQPDGIHVITVRV